MLFTSAAYTFWFVQPLSTTETTNLMLQYLSIFGKTLDEKQKAMVLDCDRTRTPLYLVTFLQEASIAPFADF